MTALARRTLLGAGVALAAGAASLHAGAAPAAAGCILTATYMQIPYDGAGAISSADVSGTVAGPGTIPACNDTPGSGVVEQPAPALLLRVRGVAPRFGVALVPVAGGTANLMVARATPCVLGGTEGILACLRRATTRLNAGPALITDPSATAGSVISVAVHVRDRALRRRLSVTAATILQRRAGTGWRTVAHLAARAGRPGQVTLPIVSPGLYRIGRRVTVGSRATQLFATITILPAPPPCTGACTHA